MKKYFTLYIFSLIALCSCNNQNNSANQNNETTPKRKANIITKHIPIGAEFTHLTSVSGADIVYSQGDYNMEVTGDSAVIQYLETNFDSNILTLSLGSERNPELNAYEGKQNVTINISAPYLQCVAICSSGSFTSRGKWSGEKIELGIIGSGNFSCDSIDCKIFDLQSSGKGNADFTHIQAESIHFSSTAETGIKADIETDLIMAENQGTTDFHITGHAKNKEIYQGKKGKILFE